MAELRGSRASSSPAAIPKLQIPGSPPETAGGGEPVEEAWDPLSLWGLFNARCIIVAMVCNKFVVCELGRGGCRLTLHDSATRHRLRVTELWFFVRSHAGLCELYATAPADLLERREPRDLDLEPPCSPIPLAGIEPPSEPLS